MVVVLTMRIEMWFLSWMITTLVTKALLHFFPSTNHGPLEANHAIVSISQAAGIVILSQCNTTNHRCQ